MSVINGGATSRSLDNGIYLELGGHLKLRNTQCRNMLSVGVISGCALLLASIIQAACCDVTVYHTHHRLDVECTFHMYATRIWIN